MSEEIISLVISFDSWKTQGLSDFDRGWGNGYVGVPEGHPWYKVPYNDIDVEIHWGLTFGSLGGEMKESSPMYKYPDLYFVGFDTAHCDDNQYNCDKNYVEKETEHLKQQAIHAVEK